MLEQRFPNLSHSPYQVTSPRTQIYNCIAWAAGFDDRWMWPDMYGMYFWPSDVHREETIPAFVEAFSTFGYEICNSEGLEPDREKVAIYAIHDQLKHVARQLPSGSWTSKCGKLEDISHSLDGLQGSVYGEVTTILSRTKPD